MSNGTVKWFNPTKGYGFIQPQGGGQDVFVHISAVEKAGLSTLNEGQQVEFEVVSNRGKSSAENLKVKWSSLRLIWERGGPIKPTRIDDTFGGTAEWYLTVRCTNPTCARLIAFQKSADPGYRPNLRIAVTGKPSVVCPHCKAATRFRRDQIERRQVVLT
jgi:cold shock protein